jgi:DNA-binding XRE family transcriptional regulator
MPVKPMKRRKTANKTAAPAPAPATFAEKLKAVRGNRWTQTEAAAAIGVSPKTFVNWEQARNLPDSFKQKALLAALASVAA